jgi:hypothetical protein
MSGFSSQDNFISNISNTGNFFRTDWNKNTFNTTAHTAGTWYLLSQTGGNPAASSILGTGTNLAFQQLLDSTATAAGIQHGGDVTSFKTIINASAFTSAPTVAPCVLMLVDLLGFYPITTTTLTTSQTLNNTVTQPLRDRTGTGNGVGVQAILVPSTVMGAGTPTVTLTYTNAAGTASRTTPTLPSLPIINTTAPVTQVAYSGTGSGKYGPFIPLANGDTGIRSVQSIQFSATHTSGVHNLIMCRPLLTMPITTLGVACERDLLNQVPSLPRVYNGACLAWMMYAGAASPVNSALYGHLDFGWS